MKVAMRREKTGHTWLWARVYGVVGPALVLGAFVVPIVQILRSERWSWQLTFLFFVLGAPSIALHLSAHAFRWPYSVFGKRRRTPLPSVPPWFERGGTWGFIGIYHVRGLFLSWYVWPEGIGFAGVGEGFIPKELVRSVEVKKRYGTIEHDSPEVRGPLVVPREIAEFASDFDSIPAGVTTLPPGRGRTKAHRLGLSALFGVLALVGAIAVYGTLQEARVDAARADVRGFVREAGENAELIVDGRARPDSKELLGLLGSLDRGSSHNSHPMRRSPVVVRHGDRSLELEMGRDSERADEYWVYLPRDWTTDHNEVGRIRTRALDSVP